MTSSALAGLTCTLDTMGEWGGSVSLCRMAGGGVHEGCPGALLDKSGTAQLAQMHCLGCKAELADLSKAPELRMPRQDPESWPWMQGGDLLDWTSNAGINEAGFLQRIEALSQLGYSVLL